MTAVVHARHYMQITYVKRKPVSGHERGSFRLDAVEEGRERVGELLDAFGLEGRHDVVVVDSRVGELREKSSRIVHTLDEGLRDDPVILERLDSNGIVFTVSGPMSSST